MSAVLHRARAADIGAISCQATVPDDWPAVEALCCKTAVAPILFPAYGLHPWFVRRARPENWLDRLGELLAADPSASIGEIGLDHASDVRDDSAQEPVFLAQYQLSLARRRPVSIHCRRAWGRMMELIAPFGPHPAGILFHSYSGGEEWLPRLESLNAYASFSGSITLLRNERGRRAAAAVPDHRLLIETDSPDIGYEGRPKGALTEPKDLRVVAHALAALRNCREQDLAELTWNNAMRFYGRPQSAPASHP